MSPGKSRVGGCPGRGLPRNWTRGGERRLPPPRLLPVWSADLLDEPHTSAFPRRKAPPASPRLPCFQPRSSTARRRGVAPARPPVAALRSRVPNPHASPPFSQQNQKPRTVLLQKSILTNRRGLTAFSFQHPRS